MQAAQQSAQTAPLKTTKPPPAETGSAAVKGSPGALEPNNVGFAAWDSLTDADQHRVAWPKVRCGSAAVHHVLGGRDEIYR